MIDQPTVERFARLLENKGYTDARRLVQDELLPIAMEKNISLAEAASEYADSKEKQDTSWHQLHVALTQITDKELAEFNLAPAFT